jgi:hypothetical protein
MRHSLLFTAVAALGLAACSPQGAPSAPSAPAAPAHKGPSAAQQFALYEQMLAANNAELAVPLGDEILRTFPDSPEAEAVREKIETLRSQASQEGEQRRMARLWSYQISPMAGGTQSTATVYDREEPGVKAERVRLVLRRHTEWGQSVFLYGAEPGFTCAKACRVSVRFDDIRNKSYLGSIPPTGEPAIFIEEDKAFIADIQKARTVAIDVTEKGKQKRTLVFEVGGFEPEKFQPLPKTKK